MKPSVGRTMAVALALLIMLVLLFWQVPVQITYYRVVDWDTFALGVSGGADARWSTFSETPDSVLVTMVGARPWLTGPSEIHFSGLTVIGDRPLIDGSTGNVVPRLTARPSSN